MEKMKVILIVGTVHYSQQTQSELLYNAMHWQCASPDRLSPGAQVIATAPLVRSLANLTLPGVYSVTVHASANVHVI